MSSFDERLTAAASKPRKYKDVPVILEEDAVEERDRLVAALRHAEAEDAADPRMATVGKAEPIREALAALSESLRNQIVTLRFVRLPGDLWGDLTLHNPARPDVELDQYYGYNLDAVVRAAAHFEDPRDPGVRYAFQIEDGEPVPLTHEQIDTLWSTLSGSEVSSIRDAVWGLNDFGPSQHIEELVKGFGATTRSETN